jgi:hypothetical protein
LLRHLKESHALRSLKLARFTWNSGRAEDLRRSCFPLIELILNATFQNPGIQTLDLHIPDFPLPTFTQLVIASPPRLSTLKLWTVCRDRTDFADAAAAVQLAIRVLPTLEVLELAIDPIGPFMGPLTAVCSSLRSLAISCANRANVNDTDVASLSGLLSCRDLSLQHISLENFRFDVKRWTEIARALEGNAQITILTMKSCHFDDIAHFASPDPLTLRRAFKNIHTLELLSCEYEHRQRNVHFPNLSSYLPFTVRLRTLTVNGIPHFDVPWNDFLIALRQNGSIHSVLVHDYPDRLPPPQVVRNIPIGIGDCR